MRSQRGSGLPRGARPSRYRALCCSAMTYGIPALASPYPAPSRTSAIELTISYCSMRYKPLYSPEGDE